MLQISVTKNKLTVYYPSGRRKLFVYDEEHKKICRAISRGINVERVITDIIASTHPQEITRAASKLVKVESTKLCKRGSGSVLQKKELDNFLSFSWEDFFSELVQLCPSILSVLTAMVSDVPPTINSKAFHHILLAGAICFHGRNQEMSVVQYLTGFVLNHGGCTLRDIERLASIGLSVHPRSIHNKLSSWQDKLDKEVIALKDSWATGGKKYQLIGDNWDRNILPSFRTSIQKTTSIHLFNLIAVVDRITPEVPENSTVLDISDIDISTYIPSVNEQDILLEELTFIFSTSVITNLSQFEQLFKGVYPTHLQHKYSEHAGVKTSQYPLGLFDCNENKTQEVIQLLKKLTEKYVPLVENEIYEAVFLGGDRLTDERIQSAQKAMLNGNNSKEKLEGFISKIEDFHRLMNFLEAIFKMTYSSSSGQDRGTLHYYRNLLNLRNVKGPVKNAYRDYKLLYYTVLDAIIIVLFLNSFNITELDAEVPLPDNFVHMTNGDKISWLNGISKDIIKKSFFDGETDIFKTLRDILTDPNHPENYWLSNLENGRIRCHFCPKTYCHVGSLQSHEIKVHSVTIKKTTEGLKTTKTDQIQDYILLCFKLVLLHKNLDTSVDMGDGERSVRSAKYELPLYNKTNKIKYAIGSIHLTALTSGILPTDQQKRLTANRFINLQGGKNNNIALDEFVEMLNRDSKVACSGHQTKDSILDHSKEYPHIVNMTKHFDKICGVVQKKGFHHLPSYKQDVMKVAKDLLGIDVLKCTPGRNFKFKGFSLDRNPYDTSFKGLGTIIHRHRPLTPYRRLRDPHI